MAVVENICDYVEQKLFHEDLIDELHELILTIQHSFGYFEWYELGSSGDYDPAMDSLDVVSNVLIALRVTFD